MERSPQDEDGLGSDLTREHLTKVGGRKDRRSSQQHFLSSATLSDLWIIPPPLVVSTTVHFLLNKKKSPVSREMGKRRFWPHKMYSKLQMIKKERTKKFEKTIRERYYFPYKTLDD